MNNPLGKDECFFCGAMAGIDPVKFHGTQYDCPNCGLYRMSSEAGDLINHRDVTPEQRLYVKKEIMEKELQGREDPRKVKTISTDWLYLNFFEIFDGKSINN